MSEVYILNSDYEKTVQEHLSSLAMDPSVRVTVRTQGVYLMQRDFFKDSFRDKIEAVLSGDANYEIRQLMKTVKD